MQHKVQQDFNTDAPQGVDPSIGFDIEVKMATPPDLAATPPREIERMVAPILATVKAVADHSSRPIIFSSFDPDICRCFRSPKIPVLDCGETLLTGMPGMSMELCPAVPCRPSAPHCAGGRRPVQRHAQRMLRWLAG